MPESPRIVRFGWKGDWIFERWRRGRSAACSSRLLKGSSPRSLTAAPGWTFSGQSDSRAGMSLTQKEITNGKVDAGIAAGRSAFVTNLRKISAKRVEHSEQRI
jgi:hypothetical protein